MTLVFIHGSGGDARVWRRQTEHFDDALALNLPGHPEGDPLTSIEAAADWVSTELSRRGIDRPILVGHSLGGGICLQLALDHPTDFAGLILIGSGARLRVHPATLEALEGFQRNCEGFSQVFEDWFAKVESGFARELERNAVDLGPRAFLADLRACDRFDVIDRLGEIELPTLAIVGTEDVMTPPKYSEFMLARLPHARMEVVEGGTHFVFAEFPDQVNAAITTFRDEIAKDPPPTIVPAS